MLSLIREAGMLLRVNAYIDPSSGGLIFQALAVMFGLLSGTILFFSGRIRLFFAKFRRGRREMADQADEAPETDENLEE